jgi:hypothetical protein
MLRHYRDLAVGSIHMPRVGEMKVSRGWDVESEAPVVIGSRAFIVTIGCVGGPGCT